MKSTHLFRNFIFLFSLLGLGSFAWGDRFEILYKSGLGYTSYIEIAEGEEAQIFSYQFWRHSGTNQILFKDASGSENAIYSSNVEFGPNQTLLIPGPGFIRGRSVDNNNWVRLLVKIKTATQSVTAKYATVIPENAKTNVSVILEQSTDLVNWTAASPGEFTPSTSKRFFRVRTANVAVAITGASNAAPIVITSAGHGLSTGDAISVSGVAGNTAANGVFTITKVDDNTFSLNGSTGNAAYTSGGTWLPSP